MRDEEKEKLLFTLHPVGVIRTPYTRAAGTPIQPVFGRGVEGEVIVEETYEPALADIDGFERLWLIMGWTGPGHSDPVSCLIVTRSSTAFLQRALPAVPNPSECP